MSGLPDVSPIASSECRKVKSYSTGRHAHSRTSTCCRFMAAKDGWSELVASSDDRASMTDIVAHAPSRRVAFPSNWPARIAFVVLGVYVVYASTILDITWARFAVGFEHGARFISRMFPPNVAPDKLQLLY